MKVYCNDRLEIMDVGSTLDTTLTEYEVPDEDFAGWSIAKICCYKIYVSLGKYCGFSPYVDSRLIQHIEQLGQQGDSNTIDIGDNSEGIYDLAEVVSDDSESIYDLADIISALDERVTALEDK